MQIFGEKCFTNPIEKIIAFDNESFIKAFLRIEELRKHYYLLGYIRYEAKDIFLKKKIKSDFPLLYFEVFKTEKDCENFAIASDELIPNAPILNIKPKMDFQTYSTAIDKIKEEIALGNTYEVNYTYDWEVKTGLEGFELFNSILPRQKTPYNAYIKNEFDEILSFSPELFFELNNNKIRTKPMKGTIARGQSDEEDEKNIEFLKNDEKNRAENVMIVDLLRNDLGKIAKTGTVKVDKLFEIETHPTLHQMTSEISAELEENTTLFEIFEAIFPCGSITGAPKISTMEIIDELEIGERGIYCGAIGLISPKKTIFSVPIRILSKTNRDEFFCCRVGGAIVWDSTAKEEWQETLTKISFLNNAKVVERDCFHDDSNFAQFKNVGWAFQPNNIRIIETMLVQDGKIQFLDEHLLRMEKSAKELDFKFYKDILTFQPFIHSASHPNCILRVLLNKQGDFQTQILPLDDIKTNRVTLSKTTVNSNEKLLYHKTTHRPWYDESMKKIKAGEVFDEIFFNERGELTEGARSNIILQINGEFFTPPVKCGLLNGIFRRKMLKINKLCEKILFLNDLKNSETVFCINSVRGIIEVQLEVNVPSPLRGEGDFQYEQKANIRKSGEGVKNRRNL